jgi:hypothetical protein
MAADALFALLLSGLVVARFGWWLKHTPPVDAADIRLFSRRLSRMVYLLIYLIIGAEETVHIIGGLEAGGSPARDLLDPAGQVFVLNGLFALVLIRVFAYLVWRRHPLRASAILAAGAISNRQ